MRTVLAEERTAKTRAFVSHVPQAACEP